jgi:hypothetical protein
VSRGIERDSGGRAFDEPSEPDRRRPEVEKVSLETKAMHRLWRMANTDLLAENLIKIEKAWEEGDDGSILEIMRGWMDSHDPVLEDLVIDLAGEDEERAWSIYRQWVRERLEENIYWRTRTVDFAQNKLEWWEELSDRNRESIISNLQAKMWKIIVEEGEAYRK